MGARAQVDEHATIQELTAQVRALLDRVAVLEGELTAPSAEPGPRQEPTVSRRGLLGRAGGYVAAGAGLAVGGSVLAARPAAAADGNALVLGATNAASSTTTLNAGTSASLAFGDTFGGALQVRSTRTGSLGMLVRGQASGIFGTTSVGGDGQTDAYGVQGSSSTYPGIVGNSTSNHGAVGQTLSGPFGVLGLNGADVINQGNPSLTLPTSGAGVGGSSRTGPGVAGVGGRPGLTGVYGSSESGAGVKAFSDTSNAIRANSLSADASALQVSLDNTTSSGPVVNAQNFGRGHAILASVVNNQSTAPAIRGEAYGAAPGVLGVTNLPSDGIDQVPPSGVVGFGYGGAFGVTAYSDTGTSLFAASNNGNAAATARITNEATGDAVAAEVTTGAGFALRGTTGGSGAAVRAAVTSTSTTARAVDATSAGRGPGLRSELTNPANSNAAVVGISRGTGKAVWGLVLATGSAAVAVAAETAGTGSALRVTASSTTSTAPALDLTHAGNGIGAQLAGGSAPLRLVPRATKGAPTTGAHLIGELVVDSAGDLFLCRVAGTPGTWRKVALV